MRLDDCVVTIGANWFFAFHLDITSPQFCVVCTSMDWLVKLCVTISYPWDILLMRFFSVSLESRSSILPSLHNLTMDIIHTLANTHIQWKLYHYSLSTRSSCGSLALSGSPFQCVSAIFKYTTRCIYQVVHVHFCSITRRFGFTSNVKLHHFRIAVSSLLCSNRICDATYHYELRTRVDPPPAALPLPFCSSPSLSSLDLPLHVQALARSCLRGAEGGGGGGR